MESLVSVSSRLSQRPSAEELEQRNILKRTSHRLQYEYVEESLMLWVNVSDCVFSAERAGGEARAEETALQEGEIPKPELFWLFLLCSYSNPLFWVTAHIRLELRNIFRSVFLCMCVCLVESEAHRRGAQRGQDSHPLQWLRGSGRSSGLRPARGQTLDQTHCCR